MIFLEYNPWVGGGHSFHLQHSVILMLDVRQINLTKRSTEGTHSANGDKLVNFIHNSEETRFHVPTLCRSGISCEWLQFLPTSSHPGGT